MTKQELRELLNKYNSGTASEEEIVLLESWYLHLASKPASEMEVDRLQRNLDAIGKALPLEEKRKSMFAKSALLKAAAAVVVLGLGYYFYPKTIDQATTVAAVDTTEFSDNPLEATITLADGKKIRLSEMDNGVLELDSSLSIVKNANGEVSYAANGQGDAQVIYNTLTTPRGGTFSIRLSDGTKVTLNAASSMKYPTAFKGERRVELTGEAYFEVHADKKNKFIVASKGQEVVVTGTRFNINNYETEQSSKTTLLEGVVALRYKQADGNLTERALKPGDLLERFDSGKIIKTQVNVDDAIAWTKGKIIFDNESIASVMRKICLWYDVEVVYETGVVEGRKIAGILSRSDDIKTVLDKIEYTGAAKFKIQGRRIIVMA